MERIEATGISIYTDDEGNIWFEDDNDKVRLSKLVHASDLYWNEHSGYVFADGQPLPWLED